MGDAGCICGVLRIQVRAVSPFRLRFGLADPIQAPFNLNGRALRRLGLWRRIRCSGKLTRLLKVGRIVIKDKWGRTASWLDVAEDGI